MYTTMNSWFNDIVSVFEKGKQKNVHLPLLHFNFNITVVSDHFLFIFKKILNLNKDR